MKAEDRVLVLDTSAFIAGFDPLAVEKEQYSVPEVKRELISGSLPWLRFKTAMAHGRLKVEDPGNQYLSTAKEASKSVGDTRSLSEADLQVLALALQLKERHNNPQIVTDDYSIQNVANELEIEFASLMTFGIKFRLEWVIYCPACHRRYPPDYEEQICEVCGTKVKRKPLRKTAVRKGK